VAGFQVSTEAAVKAKVVAMPLQGSKRVHFYRNVEMASRNVAAVT
jgi:hypothetical protein